jgi:Uncharacterized conserved protein
MTSQNRHRKQIFCALFAALTAVFSQIAIPVGPVPITLGTLAVLTAGAILGRNYGALSIGIYVLLGAIGLPVFSLFRGGLGFIMSPGGGFIIGYIFTAALVGAFVDSKGIAPKVLFPAMILGNLVCYAFGLAWFMPLTGATLWHALTVCVFPFLIGDAIKISISVFLVQKLHKIGFLKN